MCIPPKWCRFTTGSGPIGELIGWPHQSVDHIREFHFQMEILHFTKIVQGTVNISPQNLSEEPGKHPCLVFFAILYVHWDAKPMCYPRKKGDTSDKEYSLSITLPRFLCISVCKRAWIWIFDLRGKYTTNWTTVTHEFNQQMSLILYLAVSFTASNALVLLKPFIQQTCNGKVITMLTRKWHQNIFC